MKRRERRMEVGEKLADEISSFADLVLNAPIDEDTLPLRRPARALKEQDKYPLDKPD